MERINTILTRVADWLLKPIDTLPISTNQLMKEMYEREGIKVQNPPFGEGNGKNATTPAQTVRRKTNTKRNRSQQHVSPV